MHRTEGSDKAFPHGGELDLGDTSVPDRYDSGLSKQCAEEN